MIIDYHTLKCRWRRVKDLIDGFIVRNSIWITDINSSIRKNRSKKRSNDAFSLIRATNVTVADVEYDERMNLSGYALRRGRRWWELQHCAIGWRHVRRGGWIQHLRCSQGVWRRRRRRRSKRMSVIVLLGFFTCGLVQNSCCCFQYWAL